MNKNPKKDGRSDVGMAFTWAWVGTLVVYIAWNFDKVTSLEPNEFGDFLAGAFGPVALFWLVIGYFQQGEELRLQHQELANSVAEQRLLLKEQQEQTAVARFQLTEEHKKNLKAERQRERAAQPYLVVEADFGGYSDTVCNWLFTVRCHIQPCADLGFQFTDFPSPTRYIEAMTPGGKDQFELATPKNIDGRELVVWYRDMEGQRMARIFTTKQIGETQLIFVEEEEEEDDHE